MKNEEEDPFLKFVDYDFIRKRKRKGRRDDKRAGMELDCVLDSQDLHCIFQWRHLCYSLRLGMSRIEVELSRKECITQLKKKHRREKLPNAVTIDSIYEKKLSSLSSVIESMLLFFEV